MSIVHLNTFVVEKFIRHAVCGTQGTPHRMSTKLSDASKSPWYGDNFHNELKEMISPQGVNLFSPPVRPSVNLFSPPVRPTTRDEKSAAARIRHRKTELCNTISKDIIVVEDFDKASKRYKKAVKHAQLQAALW